MAAHSALAGWLIARRRVVWIAVASIVAIVAALLVARPWVETAGVADPPVASERAEDASGDGSEPSDGDTADGTVDGIVDGAGGDAADAGDGSAGDGGSGSVSPGGGIDQGVPGGQPTMDSAGVDVPAGSGEAGGGAAGGSGAAGGGADSVGDSGSGGAAGAGAGDVGSGDGGDNSPGAGDAGDRADSGDAGNGGAAGAQDGGTDAAGAGADTPDTGGNDSNSNDSNNSDDSGGDNNGGSGPPELAHPVGLSSPSAPPNFAATNGWRVTPASLLLAPGEAAVVEVMQIDADGLPTGAAIGTPAVSTSSDGVASFSSLGDGRFQVMAGSAPGSVIAGFSAPGGDLNAALTVTVASLADGVVPIRDADVAFPAPDAVDRGTIGPWYHAGGIGPFTVAEIAARLQEGVGDDGDDIRFPLVLVDADLSEGDRIVGTEGTAVLGVVRDVVSRLYLGRSFVLVTVEITNPFEMFESIDVDVSYEDYLRAGVVPDVEALMLAAGEGPADDTDLIPGDIVEPEPLRAPGRAFVKDEPEPKLLAEPTDGRACRLTGDVSATPQLTSKMVGGVQPVFDVQFNGDLHEPMIQIRAGAKGSIGVELGITAEFSGTVGFECDVFRLAGVEMIPPPPVGAIITGNIGQAVNAVGSVKVVGGPRFEAKSSCTASLDLIAGFRYTSGAGFKNVSSFEPKFGCPSSLDITSGWTSGLGPEISVEAALGMDYISPGSIRVGGVTVGTLAKLLGYPELGSLPLLENKISPQAKLVWQSEAKVLHAARDVSAEFPDSKVSLEVGASVALTADPINWLMSRIKGGDPDRSKRYVILELSPPKTFAVLYRPVGKGTVSARAASGEQTSGTVLVGDGDEVEITAQMAIPSADALLWTSSAPDLHGLDAYLQYPNSGTWEKIEGLTLDEHHATFDGPYAKATFTVPQDFCEKAGDDNATVALIPQTMMLGVKATPGYGGDFQIRCAKPKLIFEPDSISFDAGGLVGDGPHTAEASLRLTNYQAFGEAGQITWEQGDPLPDWLTMSFDSGYGGHVMLADAGDTAAVYSKMTFTVECGEHSGLLAHEVRARVENPEDSDDAVTAALMIDIDCMDSWIDWPGDDIDGVTQPGGDQPGPFQADVVNQLLVAVTEGSTDTTWTLTGADSATITGGELKAGERQVIITQFTVIDDRTAGCEEQPAYSREVTISAPGRGSLTVTVRFPFIPKVPACDPPPPPPPPPNPPTPPCLTCGGHGSGDGDPHMTTMDGIRFDAQVLGEYRYLEPNPTAAGYDAEGTRLYARHEFTWPGSAYSLKPTSITALAVESGGHTLEFYLRPELRAVVDGVDVNLGQSAGEVLPGGVEYVVSRTGDRLNARVYTPDLQLTTYGSTGGYMNMTAQSTFGGALHGFLGSYDGNAGNDLTTRDGTALDSAAVRQHGVSLYQFTDSWRLQNVADSPFSYGYDGFDATNEPIDFGLLQEYAAQAEQLLARAGAMCTGSDDQVLRDAIAWELAIDTPIDEVGAFVCTYALEGDVLVDAPAGAMPLAGADVAVTADGYRPCLARTSSSGHYRCEVTPDLTQASTTPPDGASPPNALVAVHQHGEAESPLHVVTHAFTQAAAMSQRVTERQDVLLPASAVPLVSITGSLTLGDDVVTDPLWVTVRSLDSDGAQLQVAPRVRVTPGTGGDFLLQLFIPVGTASISVTMAPSPSGSQVTTIVPLTGASPFQARVDAVAKVVTIDGSLTWGDDAVTDDVVVRMLPADGSSDAVTTPTAQTVPVDAETGRFSYSAWMPRDTTSVTLEIRPRTVAATFVVSHDLPADVLAPTLAWDVVMDRTAAFTGSLTWNGAAVTGPVEAKLVTSSMTKSLTLTPGSGGALAASVGVSPGDNYVTVLLRPDGETEWVQRQFELTGESPHPVRWDAAARRVELDASLTWGDDLVTGNVQVMLQPADGDTSSVQYQSVRTVTVDPETKRFTHSIVIPADTTTLKITTKPAAQSTYFVAESEPIPEVTGGAVTTVRWDIVMSRSITLDGSLTWDGELVRGQITAEVVASGANQTLTITPDAAGRFSLTAKLGPSSSSVLIALRPVGAPTPVSKRFSTTEVRPYVYDWDAVAEPFSLSGTVTWGGQALADKDIELRFNPYNQWDAVLNETVRTDANGYYEFAYVVQQGTSSVDIQLRYPESDESGYLSQNFGLYGEEAPYAFTWDPVARVVDVTGTITVAGAPVTTPITWYVQVQEEAGVDLYSYDNASRWGVTVVPDESGQFTYSEAMPPEANFVQFTASVLGTTVSLSQVFALDSADRQQIAIDWAERTVNLSGTYRVGGEPRGPITIYNAFVEGIDAGGTALPWTLRWIAAIQIASDGSYAVPDLAVPAGAAGLQVTMPTYQGNQALQITELTGAVTDAVVDIDLPDATPLSIQMDGSITPASIEIIGHRWSDSHLGPWYQTDAFELERESTFLNVDGAEMELVTFTGAVPDDITVITVRQLDDYGEVIATSHHDLRGRLGAEMTLDVPKAGENTVLLRVTGTLVCDTSDGCPNDGTPLMGLLTAEAVTSGSPATIAADVFVAPDIDGAFTVDVVIAPELIDEMDSVVVSVDMRPPYGAYGGCGLFCFQLSDVAGLGGVSPLLLAIKEEMTFYTWS